MVQSNGTGWDRLEYVGEVGQGQGGLHHCKVGQDGTGTGGPQIRWDRVGQWIGLSGVQLNLSTCPKVGLKGREMFIPKHCPCKIRVQKIYI